MSETQKPKITMSLDEIKAATIPRPGDKPVIVTAWRKPVAVLIPISDVAEACGIMLKLGKEVPRFRKEEKRDEK